MDVNRIPGPKIKNALTGGFIAPKNGNLLKAAFDEPTYLTIRVDFFPDSDDKSNTSYGINTGGENASFDSLPMALLSEYTDPFSYSAYRYLLQGQGDVRRAKLLKTFIEGLRELQENSPYYITSVGGLNELLKIVPKQGSRLPKDAALTLKCIDSLDQRITGLMQLYRKIVWDDEYQRWALPDIMRMFRMDIYISEFRVFHKTKGTPDYTREQTPYGEFNANDINSGKIFKDELNPFKKTTETLKAIGQSIGNIFYREKDIDNSFTLINDEIANTLMPTLKIECSMCEFDISDMYEHFSELSAADPKEYKGEPTIKIKVGNIKEHIYNILSNRQINVDDDMLAFGRRFRNLSNYSKPYKSSVDSNSFPQMLLSDRNQQIVGAKDSANPNADWVSGMDDTLSGGLGFVGQTLANALDVAKKWVDNKASDAINDLMHKPIIKGLSADDIIDSLASHNIFDMYNTLIGRMESIYEQAFPMSSATERDEAVIETFRAILRGESINIMDASSANFTRSHATDRLDDHKQAVRTGLIEVNKNGVYDKSDTSIAENRKVKDDTWKEALIEIDTQVKEIDTSIHDKNVREALAMNSSLALSKSWGTDSSMTDGNVAIINDLPGYRPEMHSKATDASSAEGMVSALEGFNELQPEQISEATDEDYPESTTPILNGLSELQLPIASEATDDDYAEGGNEYMTALSELQPEQISEATDEDYAEGTEQIVTGLSELQPGIWSEATDDDYAIGGEQIIEGLSELQPGIWSEATDDDYSEGGTSIIEGLYEIQPEITSEATDEDYAEGGEEILASLHEIQPEITSEATDDDYAEGGEQIINGLSELQPGIWSEATDDDYSEGAEPIIAGLHEIQLPVASEATDEDYAEGGDSIIEGLHEIQLPIASEATDNDYSEGAAPIIEGLHEIQLPIASEATDEDYAEGGDAIIEGLHEIQLPVASEATDDDYAIGGEQIIEGLHEIQLPIASEATDDDYSEGGTHIIEGLSELQLPIASKATDTEHAEGADEIIAGLPEIQLPIASEATDGDYADNSEDIVFGLHEIQPGITSDATSDEIRTGTDIMDTLREIRPEYISAATDLATEDAIGILGSLQEIRPEYVSAATSGMASGGMIEEAEKMPGTLLTTSEATDNDWANVDIVSGLNSIQRNYHSEATDRDTNESADKLNEAIVDVEKNIDYSLSATGMVLDSRAEKPNLAIESATDYIPTTAKMQALNAINGALLEFADSQGLKTVGQYQQMFSDFGKSVTASSSNAPTASGTSSIPENVETITKGAVVIDNQNRSHQEYI